jgi:hypothetical protein
MDLQSDQKRLGIKAAAADDRGHVVRPPEPVRALSAQQIMSQSGNTNMLQGRMINLNLFTKKAL